MVYRVAALLVALAILLPIREQLGPRDQDDLVLDAGHQLGWELVDGCTWTFAEAIAETQEVNSRQCSSICFNMSSKDGDIDWNCCEVLVKSRYLCRLNIYMNTYPKSMLRIGQAWWVSRSDDCGLAECVGIKSCVGIIL